MDLSLVLASASPRRLALLRQLGYSPSVMPVDIDESILPSEAPYAYVARMAQEKCAASIQGLLSEQRSRDVPDLKSLVLAGDTVCVQGSQILLKPTGFDDFRGMMNAMSGTEHTVATSFALARMDGLELSELALKVVKTKVHFRALSDDEIERYWATNEPCDKAGGYGIQGIGAVLVDRIEGSYSNVVGLPLTEVHLALRDAGLSSLV